MANPHVTVAQLPTELGIGCIPIKANNLWLSIIFKLIVLSLASMWITNLLPQLKLTNTVLTHSSHPVVTLIMMYVAYKRRRNSPGMRGLLKVFYRDGIFYFLTLSSELPVESNTAWPCSRLTRP